MEPPVWTPNSSEGASSYSQQVPGDSAPAGTSYFPSHSTPRAEAGPSSITLDSPPSHHPATLVDPSKPFAQPSTSLDTIEVSVEAASDSNLNSGGSRGRGRGGMSGGSMRRGRGQGGAGGGWRGRGGSRVRGGPAAAAGARRSSRIPVSINPASKTGGAVPKLKFTVKGKTGGDTNMSPFGPYDRELDEDPSEPLQFEEQFILRVPKEVADGPNGLREILKGKGKGWESVEFKFLDSRRAAFKINGVTYSSKLVDLPCIIESQKTFDSRHLFKVADISQMLVVEKPVKEESSITKGPLVHDDYFWPHGVTPPLRHVRKRRFRKRLSKRAIEMVEEQVDELMEADKAAEEVAWDTVEAHQDPEIPDEYYINYDPNNPYGAWNVHGSEAGDSEFYEDPGSVAPTEGWTEGEDGYGEGEYDDEFEEGEEFDAELAAALAGNDDDQGEDGGSEDGLSADEEEEDDDGNKSDEDDEETSEKKSKIKSITSEIKALESLIEKKKSTFTRGNAIMEKRFNETMRGLEEDVKMKEEARQALIDELEEASALKREHLPQPGVGPAGNDEGDVDMDDDLGTGTGTGTPAFTPGITPGPGKDSGVNTDQEEAYDEDDDLFGEGSGDEADYAATPTEAGDGYSPAPQQVTSGGANGDDGEDGDADGEGDVEMDEEGEDEDEMAMMLQFALNDDTKGDQAASSPAVFANNAPDEMAQANATAALESFATQGLLDGAQSGGFGVEGGVGMRRLATGAEAGDDDDSSDDSDD